MQRDQEIMFYHCALFLESKEPAKSNMKAIVNRLKKMVSDPSRHIFIDHPGGAKAPKPKRATMLNALREGRIVKCASLVHLVRSEEDFKQVRELFRLAGAKVEFDDKDSQVIWDNEQAYFKVRYMFGKAQVDLATLRSPRNKKGAGRPKGPVHMDKAKQAYLNVLQYRNDPEVTIKDLVAMSGYGPKQIQTFYNNVRAVARKMNSKEEPFSGIPWDKYEENKKSK